MLTTVDDRRGLVRVSWIDIRKRVGKVSLEFAEIIDSLSPDASFPLYLAYYPYGTLKGDTISPFLPKIDGGNYRLSDPSAPKEVIQHLSYGSTSSPLGMLLEKRLEYFVDVKHLEMTIPWRLYSPGDFFPLSRILTNKSNRTYTPNGLLNVVSGARSVFMLPKIGNATNHAMLKRYYNVPPRPPKSLYDHWQVFKGIINSHLVNNDWRACVLYFSKKWIDKIHNDSAWHPVKKYLLEFAWSNFEFERNHNYYDFAYSIIQNSRNLKPNPYLMDTAQHLFKVALGVVPGYAPSCDNESLPLDVLQKAFVDGYELKKYIPTIMQPSHFIFENKPCHPIYYSLQYPSALSFSPKSRKLSSNLFEIQELKHIVDIFKHELIKENNIFSDTVISDVAKNIEFDFFHNQTDMHNLIKNSNEIMHFDNRFSLKKSKIAAKDAKFASDAPFVRGCIGIKNK